jgi:hypothetical protein
LLGVRFDIVQRERAGRADAEPGKEPTPADSAPTYQFLA